MLKQLLILALCCTGLCSLTAQAQTVTKYEAEAAALTAPASASASGSFVENLTGPGAAVTFTVSVPKTGVYTITSRYAAALAYAWTLSVYVNNHDVTQAQFASTGDWGTWDFQQVTTYLVAGTNTIAFRYDSDDKGGVNLDYITIAVATTLDYVTGSAAASAWPSGLQVDQFSGTAQFVVPLFTITEPGISIPVALGYTASGVQVADDGGLVGVNWNIQADFGIRRVVRGLPDDCKAPSGATDARWGWLYQNQYPANSNSDNLPTAPATCSDQQAARALLDRLGARSRPSSGTYTMYDPEPDIFYYNLPGHSGRFVFDRQGQAHTFPYDPITIQCGTQTDWQTLGINGFTITTPEGTIYQFGQNDWVVSSTSSISGSQYYFGSDYLAYLGNLAYSTTWHISSILSPVGGHVEFEYQVRESNSGSYFDMPSSKEQRRFLQGNSSTASAAIAYSKTTRLARTVWLTGIKGSTTRASFELVPVNTDPESADRTAYYLKAVNLFANNIIYPISVYGDGLVKRYTFQYTQAGPDFPNVLPWFDEQGTAIDWSYSRRFLRQLDLSNGYTTTPLYTFTYAQIGTPSGRNNDDEVVPCPLPPLQAVNKDYWGFYNANQAKTAIPQLYLYPQLTSLASHPAGAPYRLFDLPTSLPDAANGLTLTGADRRPAADFSVALAGTLTEIAFGTGSKAVLEYEPHRFYDPVAHQTLPAGGVRVRTIKVLDPVTRTESRRDYIYQADENDPAVAGTSSGVLLHAPRLAFTVPAAGSSTQQQWQNATVRCGDDMGSDPFESRIVGYGRVAEVVPGRGQTITTFTAPAGADASTAASIAPSYDGTMNTWTRPVVGVASDGSSSCPSVAPLPVGADLYPFAVAPALDYQRGLPTSISYVTESSGQTTGRVERKQDFTYVNQAVAPYTVSGVAYERVGTATTAPYLYAKSQVITGYQLVPREAKTTFYTYVGTNASTRQLKTVSLYNGHGWLAAVARENSDGSYQRTRYRYLADYAAQLASYPTSSTTTVNGLRQLRTQGIGAEVIETISEVVPKTASAGIHFQESALQTYAVEPPKTPTGASIARPYQLWRYATRPPLTSRADTTSLPGDATYPGWLTATVQEVDKTTFAPISTRVETGRQMHSQHLGYYSTVPILQISGAKASEVVFSDCETYTDFLFNYAPTSSSSPGVIVATGNASYARTGQGGLNMAAGSVVTHTLPVSDAASYRLVWWARASQAATFTVNVLTAQGGAWSTQSVSLTGTDWQRFEVVLPDLSSIAAAQRPTYTLQLLTNAAVQADDILLLPAGASAVSTTVEPTLGKTSETDNRGRTLYYEYSNSGKLARVRDHNHAIVRQIEQIVAGRRSDETITPTFTVSGEQTDGEQLTFTAYGPRRTDLEYAWDFGDGTPVVPFAPGQPWVQHVYTTNGQAGVFTVTLQLRSQGSSVAYTASQQLGILAPPLRVSITISDVTAVDDCGIQPVSSTSANTHQTTYTAVPSTTGHTYSYQWEMSQEVAGYVSWTILQGVTGSALTQQLGKGPSDRGAIRCRITDTTTNEEAVSEPTSVIHYSSTPNCQ